MRVRPLFLVIVLALLSVGVAGFGASADRPGQQGDSATEVCRDAWSSPRLAGIVFYGCMQQLAKERSGHTDVIPITKPGVRGPDPGSDPPTTRLRKGSSTP